MAIYNHSTDDEDDNNETKQQQQQQRMPIIQCQESLPPVLCLACLAYLNPFCQVNTDGVWECPLCGQENVLPKGFDADTSNFQTALSYSCVEYRQPPQQDAKDMSVLGDDDYCTYLLVVDENLAPQDGQAIAPAMQALLQEHTSSKAFSKIRLGLISFGKSVATYHLGLPGLTSSDVYVTSDISETEGKNAGNVDVAETLENDMDRRAYLTEVHPGDPLTSLRNALVSLFDVSMEGPVSNGISSVSNNQQALSPRMAMLSERKEARIRKDQQDSRDVGMPTESPWMVYQKEAKSRHPVRCTGEAIQCALDLASANIRNPSRTARIILFTNGCPNNGDGSVVTAEKPGDKSTRKGRRPTHDVVDTAMLQKAVEYFDMTGNIAVSNGIGFDVFCSGPTELALPAYQALVEPSGGYVISLLSFESQKLEHNLKFLLDNTYMSRSRYIPEELSDDDSGAECILDIRTDGFISPTQLCGSGEVLPDQASRMVENERAAFAEGSALAAEKGIKTNDLPSIEALEMSMTRIQVGRVDPLTTFTIMLEVDDTIAEDDDYAFFQLVSRYVSRTGNEEITRVCSFKVPVASDISDYLSSLDDEAVSVILGKAAVYRALHGREETSETRDMTAVGDVNSQEKLAYDAQLDIDATIQRISGAFRLLGLEEKMRSLVLSSEAKKDAAESSLQLAFPPQLQQSLTRIYHMRRGHLISPGPMQSMDDRAEIRGLFLRFPLEDCLRMMEPAMWSTGSMAGILSGWDVMQPFPAETLALWDSSIVAADFHDALFVWTGANCTASRYDGIRDKFKDYLLEISKRRFPKAVLHDLKDGDSMSRRFTARLAPSHADPVGNQLVHFPALSTLTPVALEALRSKFKFYDSNSDASFRSWFWGVASASNVSRLDGTSLCE
jgi:hypothetical protein